LTPVEEVAMAEEGSRNTTRGNRRIARRRAWALGVALFLGAWLLWTVVTYAVSVRPRVYIIPTGSMAPTLRPGDRVGVETGRTGPPARGEVWVLRLPATSKQVGNEAVKRIIGLPGETVEITGGRVIIDGRTIAEPYLLVPMTYSMPPMTLGPDEYFVLGDSRNTSFDSHVWGPLPAGDLVGRVKLRYWPPKRIGGL
jgi:signal peptidase I